MKRALNVQMTAPLRTQPQRLAYAVFAASMLMPSVAAAALPAIAPDAGRLTRELQPPVELPRPGVSVTLPSMPRDAVAPGGLRITLRAVAFTGNTVFTQQQLAAVLAPAIGKPHDLAGLYALADQVSEYYRARGYAFAKAFVPENGFDDGTLTIQVVEGRFGERKAIADSPRRSAQAERFIKPLKAGAPIHSAELERRLLILGDQPGYDVLPIIKPGKTDGTGDLEVKLTRKPLVTGTVSASNHGNRYTGYHQARANIQVNSPFMFGDQLAISHLVSDRRLSSTSLNYSLPIGGSGLRANAGYSHTDYRLAREFANLEASGTAQTSSLGLSYPLIRSRQANLTVSAQGQHKRFFDEQKSVNASDSRASDSGSVMLNFDRSDRYGVTFGQVEWTMGKFTGGQPISNTNGSFSRMNADIVRLQRLQDRLSLYTRINGQKAGRNLDSSESYSIGGPYAVRAFATGEGTGDEGILGQVELRFQHSANLSPYVFVDAGRTRLEHKSTNPGKNNRSLSGTGFGVRYQHNALSIDTVIARRLSGGQQESDPRDNKYTGWFIVSYGF